MEISTPMLKPGFCSLTPVSELGRIYGLVGKACGRRPGQLGPTMSDYRLKHSPCRVCERVVDCETKPGFCPKN